MEQIYFLVLPFCTSYDTLAKDMIGFQQQRDSPPSTSGGGNQLRAVLAMGRHLHLRHQPPGARVVYPFGMVAKSNACVSHNKGSRAAKAGKSQAAEG